MLRIGGDRLLPGLRDIVALARQALADPDWFVKVRGGHGSVVNVCSYSNYCEALDEKHLEVTCSLWDRIGRSEAGVRMSRDGKRRLLPPAWAAPVAEGREVEGEARPTPAANT